jgi:hypothetical protein
MARTGEAQIAYIPRQTELNTLAACYRFILDCHERNKGTRLGAPDDERRIRMLSPETLYPTDPECLLVVFDLREPEAGAVLHRQRTAWAEGERLEESLWMKTVKAYNERERRQMRAEWTGGTWTRPSVTGALSPLS